MPHPIPIIHHPDNAESLDTLRTRALLKGSLEIVPEKPDYLQRRRAAQEAARFMAGLPTDEEDPDYWGMGWIRERDE
jgi:hypothetical protein